MFMEGASEAEWFTFLPIHNNFTHRITFEETELGRLPLEILLKILGYVTPDCKSCFLQRDLLRLGSVCKKLNEIMKAPDLYKEMNLSDECCPLPTKKVFEKMVEKSGSQLKRIRGNYKCRDLLYIAVTKCGNVLQEIHVEEPQEPKKHTSLSVPADMLHDISRLNPSALIKMRFQNNSFELTMNVRGKGGKQLFKRIHELSISWNFNREIYFYTAYNFSDRLRDYSFIKDFKYFLDVPTFALQNIQGLKRAILKMALPNHIQLNDETERKIREKVEALDASLCHKMCYKKGTQTLEIITELKSEIDQLQKEPEAAFKAFLEYMRRCYVVLLGV